MIHPQSRPLTVRERMIDEAVKRVMPEALALWAPSRWHKQPSDAQIQFSASLLDRPRRIRAEFRRLASAA